MPFNYRKTIGELPLPNYQQWAGIGVSLIGTAFGNFATGKPLASRAPLYALTITFGYCFGTFIHNQIMESNRAKNTYIWDYVAKHPEDFPELEKKKYRDVLEPWYPIRSS